MARTADSVNKFTAAHVWCATNAILYSRRWRTTSSGNTITNVWGQSNELGGASAATSATENAAGIIRVLANLGAQQHGRFWTWNGREPPWWRTSTQLTRPPTRP